MAKKVLIISTRCGSYIGQPPANRDRWLFIFPIKAMSNILLYRQFFFHSLTFCPMDNRSTFFLPFIPQTHTAVVSCCNGRRSLPPFPLYAWAYHFMESPLSPRPVFTQQRYGERTACQVPLRYSG